MPVGDMEKIQIYIPDLWAFGMWRGILRVSNSPSHNSSTSGGKTEDASLILNGHVICDSLFTDYVDH